MNIKEATELYANGNSSRVSRWDTEKALTYLACKVAEGVNFVLISPYDMGQGYPQPHLTLQEKVEGREALEALGYTVDIGGPYVCVSGWAS